jgi:hypothetical protein
MIIKKKVLIVWILFMVYFLSLFSSYTVATDLLDSVFETSKSLDHVINIGNNKNAVGNEVFQWSTNLNVSLNNGVSTSTNAPLLVRITQTLLRLTIALSIPVLIWIGVKVIKSGMSGWDVKGALKEVSGVLIGLALALSAVGIIYLIQSLTTQSLVL